MARVIRLHDIARAESHELGPEERVLRGPYELFHPIGSIHRRGDSIEWFEGALHRSARAVPASLGETHPGERVLVRLPPYGVDEDDEWWLCEVEAVDGRVAAE